MNISPSNFEPSVDALLAKMTVAEKLGQLWQLNNASPENLERIRRGEIGSLLNLQAEAAAQCQRIAREESRLGIPLLIGRDIIHGYKTLAPIPLGQAATFNAEVVHAGARMAAREGAAAGMHWTFAPMVDISRDPRWGRVAEGFGEDPMLSSVLGAAMVEGFQGAELGASQQGGREAGMSRLHELGSLAACAKHYVGYGNAEAGRDYNTTSIPERLLRNVYLPPFLACIEAGCATVMTGFSELNDIPATGNQFILRQILRSEWNFDGLVVSDWGSVGEMITHGYCANKKEAAFKALRAGVDMEMISDCYQENARTLMDEGLLRMEWIDDAVRRVLRLKFRVGLFDVPIRPRISSDVWLSDEHLAIARAVALESFVLLKNNGVLPLSRTGKILISGPLADASKDQMGCWKLDGVASAVRTPLTAFREMWGAENVLYFPGLETARDTGRERIAGAVEAAREADAVVLFVGEDALLTGEAHSRGFLDLPGAQNTLIEAMAAVGKPVIVVVLAGRPLVLTPWIDRVGAVLFAWHPGTMGGPALVDIITGVAAPSGRLPVSFPRAVGQIPCYYNHKNTGRPASPDDPDVSLGSPENPVGFSAKHLDVPLSPAFPFGFGLTYTSFAYSPVTLSTNTVRQGEVVFASVNVTNTGSRPGATVAQLYLRDLSASATRPVRELKGFQKVTLQPGEQRKLSFQLTTRDLAFWNGEMEFTAEPGEFHVWIAQDSTCNGLPPATFRLV